MRRDRLIALIVFRVLKKDLFIIFIRFLVLKCAGNSLWSLYQFSSFSSNNWLVSLGSALPLDIFFTSPTNRPISPFFPFLYSVTLSGIFARTCSTQATISLVSELCNRFRETAISRGSRDGSLINAGKIREEAMEKLNRPSSTNPISRASAEGATGKSFRTRLCSFRADFTGPSSQLAAPL